MSQTPRFQLLIVDDDRELRETMASWFSDTCIVQTASSGEEALALVERQSFDVGIFDMVMPGMTG
ncbi:MAG: response regulator, partial [Planctomycetaceae bacterium]|nr:response regulator [Planctomycetaceae bacterium]